MFSNDELQRFDAKNCVLNAIFVSCNKQNLAFVLKYNVLLNLLGENNKMLDKGSNLIFSPTRLINSIIHKHSCKILCVFLVQFGFTIWGVGRMFADPDQCAPLRPTLIIRVIMVCLNHDLPPVYIMTCPEFKSWYAPSLNHDMPRI